MSSRRKLATLTVVLLVAAGATGGALASQSHSAVKAVPVPHLAGKGLLAAASIYLAIPLPQLKRELHPGHPLAAIASNTPGRTVAGLKATLVYDAMASLHRAQGAISRVRMRYAHTWVVKRVSAYVAGACPLRLGNVFVKLGGGCPGMSM
jgi:hypothetical protein